MATIRRLAYLVSGLFLSVFTIVTLATSAEILSFSALYEPSGVIQTETGEVIIIEDGGETPIYLTSFQSSNKGLILAEGQAFDAGIIVDDLEGITVTGLSSLFAITSHSTTTKGKQKGKREQLLKLDVSNNSVRLIKNNNSLQPYIIEKLQQLDGLDAEQIAQINIEGLSFDKSGKTLLIGLRSPTVGGKSIILELLNPFALFETNESPRFSDQLILLNLEGAGIRAFEYSPHLNRYLLAGEVKNKKGKLRPRIWTWDGDVNNRPTRVVLPKIKGIRNIEGITPIIQDNTHRILIVCDDGKPDYRNGAHYLLINSK